MNYSESNQWFLQVTMTQRNDGAASGGPQIIVDSDTQMQDEEIQIKVIGQLIWYIMCAVSWQRFIIHLCISIHSYMFIEKAPCA